MNILVPRSKKSTSKSVLPPTELKSNHIIVSEVTQPYIEANEKLQHVFSLESRSNSTHKEDLPRLFELKFRSKNTNSLEYQENEQALNRMGQPICRGTFPNVHYNEMRSFIANNITNDGGESFFGDMLGFTEYINVLDYDRSKQIKHVQRVQQPFHIQLCKANIPGFLSLFQLVERRCIEVYGGLEIMYFDMLHQGKNTSNVYTLHQDNDYNNNPGGASVYRSLIVKISDGTSVSVSVAGHPVYHYATAAGSFIDFRSDAWHQSVMPPLDSNFVENYKIVFFLGRRGRIDDGREGEDNEKDDDDEEEDANEEEECARSSSSSSSSLASSSASLASPASKKQRIA